jgi:ABC-type oligopeptide transport system substrate-binding subunit
MFKKISLFITMLLMVFAVSACKPADEPEVVNAAPTITGTTSVSYVSGTVFDPKAGVTAADAEDGDLTSSIVVVSNNVDTLVAGIYTVVLRVTDSGGLTASLTRTVNVALPLANYLSGVNLSQLSIEDKGIIFAALESYLLENVAAGVPLYTRAARVMFSNRVQLFSPIFNGVLGFGVDFSQLSADDSTVLMYGSEYGNAGEYTFRTSFNTDPNTLNPWISDDSVSSDFIGRFTGGLYDFYFDASKTGYELNPSLASAEPIAVDPEVVNGKTYSKIWQIPIKDDLEWTFHPDTDTSGFAAGFEVLDASDWLWTWEEAMTEGWFRARSGGGDFITMGVKNAAEYLNGSITDFGEVGLRMADGETNVLELEFVTDKSAFDIKYMFGGASLAALNQELFESVGFAGYGLTPETVASSGVYYFDTWTPGQFLLFTKNEAFTDSAMYHYTNYQYRFIDGSDQIFEEFLAGRLDTAAVPASQVTAYASDPRVKVSPDATTWRLMINGFGTEEARDAYIAQYPELGLDETWVPEPILMYTEFKQALYYGFDRYEAAVNVVKTYLPAHTLFAPTYFLDGESGMSVRGTAAGAAVVETFGGDSNGYFPDAALALFKSAIADAIADGYYTAGTASAYTVIELELYWASSGNTGAQAMVAEMIQQYETLLVDDVNFVRVVINENDVAFPGNYYDYMMVAKMDLGIGGISGSLLDAPSFLDVFNDDNKGGFTLNWGIDTHTPNIAVTYTNLEGVEVSEVWGYNALTAALNGNVYIKDGMQQVAWSTSASLIDAYLDMNGEALDSSADGTDLALYILGDTLVDLAADEGFDSLIATTVTTESGKNILYVISVEGSVYKLYGQFSLFTTAKAAIEDHSGYDLVSTTIMTDADILTNDYLISLATGFTTIAEYATDAGAPVAFAELWATDFGWQDAYIVLHIGDYYVGWLWL